MSSVETLLVGPAIESFGGTQSVIEVMQRYSIGADRVRATGTWHGPGHVTNARLIGHSGRLIAHLPMQTIVHFHLSNGGAWLREGTLLRLASARGLRTVVTLHGYEVADFARHHPRFVSSMLRHTHHVTCLSHDAQAVVSALLPSVPVTVLANPVVVDTLAPPAHLSKPVALFAGEIGRRKGVDVLVDAWRLLLSQGITGQCRLVGPIADFAPPKLERLMVQPAVPRSTVPALIRAARVIVLPSRAEGMPMILTEALAAARPIIATPVGGVRMIVPDDSMIVPVADAEALARSMRRYLEHPDRATADGSKGQKHMSETRSPAVIDSQLRAIYEGLT